MPERRIAFVGAGAVAHCHAYALSALRFYYPGPPTIRCVAVTSATERGRDEFAARYGFNYAIRAEDLWQRNDVDTVYILSPNGLHFAHFEKAWAMESVRRIYIEKPLCATPDEEQTIVERLVSRAKGKDVQLGFQFLQMSSVRYARSLWGRGGFGAPVHFHARYLHAGYLDLEYRHSRIERLKPAPEGGATVDLGSHAFSLLTAFLGESLQVVEAEQSRGFADVPRQSDLCTVALLRDTASGAVGTVTASRISAGAGEVLELEIRCTTGGFRLSTELPDRLEVFSASAGASTMINCGSDFDPASHFPARVCPAGWLRSLVHANYLFLCDPDDCQVPDLKHGLTVQRLLRETVERIQNPWQGGTACSEA